MGGVVEVRAEDEEFTRAASVLAEDVGGAGVLSLTEVEVSLVAEIVSLKVTLESEIVAGAGVIVDDLVEATTLLSDVVEAGVATAEGVDVGPFEISVEVADVVEAGVTSLVAEPFNLVMVKKSETTIVRKRFLHNQIL